MNLTPRMFSFRRHSRISPQSQVEEGELNDDNELREIVFVSDMEPPASAGSQNVNGLPPANRPSNPKNAWTVPIPTSTKSSDKPEVSARDSVRSLTSPRENQSVSGHSLTSTDNHPEGDARLRSSTTLHLDYAIRKRKRGFDARVSSDGGSVIYLGRFKTKEDAYRAVEEVLARIKGDNSADKSENRPSSRDVGESSSVPSQRSSALRSSAARS